MKLSASSGLVCVALSAAVVPGAGAQTVSDPALQVESVVNGLAAPTTMDFLGPDDFLVLQKNDGRVRRVLGGTLLAAPVLDVTVTNNSERGLLGIAIDREASPPIVFLYYTEGIGPGDGSSPLGNRIYRYRWNSSTGLLENGDLVADLPVTPGPNHDGGALLLGPPGDPDGRTLYAVIGDLNRDGQLENFPAGSPPDDTAVILALRADGSADPDNPFFPYCSQSTGQTCTSSGECPAGQTCRTEVRRYFAYGVRNSFGLGMDPVTGALWDTENGPSSYDEVNLVAPGFNSGWERIMGPDARDPQGSADLFHMPGGASEYSDPELSWLDPVAPTAILFPVGSALGPAYDGVALVADNNTGSISRLPLDAARGGFDFSGQSGLGDLVADTEAEAAELRMATGLGAVTDLELGPDGFVYAVSISRGTVYRVRPRPASTPTVTPTRTSTPTPTPSVCRELLATCATGAECCSGCCAIRPGGGAGLCAPALAGCPL